jgi:hypothetical protein
MSETEAIYLTHQSDDSPDTFMYFDPDGDTTIVHLSSPRFELFDNDEGCGVEYSDDEDEIYRLLDKHLMDNDLAILDEGVITAIESEECDPRFYVNDCRDQDMQPDWLADGGFGSRYVRTDGWRGHTQVTHNDSWEAYTGGWVTGYPDEYTSYKMTAANLHNGLYDGTIDHPPFPIVWFFGVTSNVFSQTSDILIPTGKSEEFETWLSEVAGYSPEDVRHAFS